MGLSYSGNRRWTLTALDTDKNNAEIGTVTGEFEAVDVNRTVETAWLRQPILNRQGQVTQWLHGVPERFSFQGRIFKRDVTDTGVFKPLNKLIEWTKKIDYLGRPPIVAFTIGNPEIESAYGDLTYTIDAISDIRYDDPSSNGAPRGCTFMVHLTQYSSFSLEPTENPRTRYHQVALGEDYEMICLREYGDPLFAIIIRHENPENLYIEPGDVVPLPSQEAISGDAIEPKSHVFAGITSGKQTSTKDVLEFHVNRLNVTKTSAVL